MVTFGQEMQSAEITGDTDMSQSGSRSDDEIEIAAVIFDMDGVLTDTAHAHFSAWKETFDTFLKDCGVDEPFTRNDYLKNVDGVAALRWCPRLPRLARHPTARRRPRRRKHGNHLWTGQPQEHPFSKTG